ncbi:hypothetical protein HNR08_003536 [Cellulomonas hominis]|uniref:Uncharacterized protein n=1 Tax=Cellulomonas hominis TaxID=156981 RepID=A0A7W8WAU7_9CELL|nr:hypothetical protein [Cellulomonas hominis]
MNQLTPPRCCDDQMVFDLDCWRCPSCNCVVAYRGDRRSRLVR